MKKQVKRYRIALIPIVVFLFGFSLFTMGAAGSQQQLKPRRQIKPKRAACDLVVERIELDEKCQVRVTIKNQGSAGVADGAYNTPPLKGVAIQAIAENSGWGGYILNVVDPHRKLKTPGASVSFTGFKRALNAGEVLSIRMDIINPGNVGHESNLTNNSKTVRLRCIEKQCDLIVERIELDEKCQVRVTIKNQGSAGVADGAYNTPPLKGVAIQAIAENSGWGGYILDAVDPQRKLKTPGASVSFTGFKRALNTGEILTVRMDIINPGNVGNESNLTNNSKTVRLLCKK